MTKAKSKCKTASRLKNSKTKTHDSAVRTTARKNIKLKPFAKPAAGQQSRPSSQLVRSNSKQARIVAMLRAPSGATTDAMARAAGWQQHSVRGFLAGVVRKKLGLNLVSAVTESGRVYRITDRTGSSVAAAKTSHAA